MRNVATLTKREKCGKSCCEGVAGAGRACHLGVKCWTKKNLILVTDECSAKTICQKGVFRAQLTQSAKKLRQAHLKTTAGEPACCKWRGLLPVLQCQSRASLAELCNKTCDHDVSFCAVDRKNVDVRKAFVHGVAACRKLPHARVDRDDRVTRFCLLDDQWKAVC